MTSVPAPRSPLPLVAAIVAGGVVLWLLTIVSGIIGGRSSFDRFAVPGIAQLQLKAGAYTLYHEFPRTVDSQEIIRPAGVDRLECTLRSGEGQSVALRPATSTARYVIRRTVGEPVYDFTIDTAGSYQFDSAYPADFAGPGTTFAVGRSYSAQVVATFGRGLLIVAATVALVAIVLFRTRRRPVHPPSE
jgi:hypothetical protein